MCLLLFFVDADAALLRDGGGVDAVHIFRALQQTCNRGVAHQVDFGLGQRAAIGEADALDAAFAGLREEGAEPAGEIDERRELHVFLVAERGQIDGVLHHAELEILAHLGGDLDADGFLRFCSGAGDVRREDDVVETEVRRVFGRLDGEDVEGRAGDVAAFERGDEGRVFDQLAAGAVDDAHALLHGGESLGVDDAVGLRREADVQGEVVGLGEELVERDELDAVFARHGGGDEGIAADEFHAEAAGALGDFETDAAEAENAEGLAAQLRALKIFLLPLAGVHGAVGRGQFAGEREHEADGELGNGDGVGAGRVHDHNAAAGGGFGVDVVHAHAGAANDAQLRRVLHQLVVDLHGRAHDQRIGIGQRGRQGRWAAGRA